MARMDFSTDRAPASRMDFYCFDRRSNSCSGSTGAARKSLSIHDKIFLFYRNKLRSLHPASIEEGRSRTSRTRDGMRWTLMR
jgi:hypothetical protein